MDANEEENSYFPWKPRREPCRLHFLFVFLCFYRRAGFNSPWSSVLLGDLCGPSSVGRSFSLGRGIDVKQDKTYDNQPVKTLDEHKEEFKTQASPMASRH